MLQLIEDVNEDVNEKKYFQCWRPQEEENNVPEESSISGSIEHKNRYSEKQKLYIYFK